MTMLMVGDVVGACVCWVEQMFSGRLFGPLWRICSWAAPACGRVASGHVTHRNEHALRHAVHAYVC